MGLFYMITFLTFFRVYSLYTYTSVFIRIIMTAASEKLTYFNLGAKGQFIRLAYVFGGIDFDDERVEFSEWPALKASTPLGQLPVLTVDGKQYAQSTALLRYVGGRVGLYPTPGTKEQLIVEDVIESITEVWVPPPNDKEARRAYVDGKISKALTHIESLITDNSGADAPFVTGEITVADLYIYG
jgi:glutathione S-transferase